MNVLTDLLFPELIGYKPSKKRKIEIGSQNPYIQAKRTLEYWLRLAKLPFRLVERYGSAILLLLPDSVTDTM